MTPGAAVARATPSRAALIPPVAAGMVISRCRGTRRLGRAVSSQPQPSTRSASRTALSPAAKPVSPAACGAVPIPFPVAWVTRYRVSTAALSHAPARSSPRDGRITATAAQAACSHAMTSMDRLNSQ